MAIVEMAHENITMSGEIFLTKCVSIDLKVTPLPEKRQQSVSGSDFSSSPLLQS